MNMKKLSSILLALLVVLSAALCGCGNGENQISAESAKEETTLTVDREKSYKYNTREIWCDNNGNKIYGIAYIPETDQKCPLVITCHGLGTNHESGVGYAEHYAEKGIAAYCFDFCGGTKSGDTNKSDGKSTDMSVMTEVSDLEAIINTAQTWDFVDSSRIFLQGGSMGGLVSAITGLKQQDKVAGLILLYPAFGIYNFIHYAYKSPDEISGTMEIVDGMTVGEAFFRDLWDYDAMEHIKDFKKPVIIIQGSDDDIVKPEMSEKASKLYPDCEYKVIDGAGHGFGGKELDQAAEYALEFLFKNS